MRVRDCSEAATRLMDALCDVDLADLGISVRVMRSEVDEVQAFINGRTAEAKVTIEVQMLGGPK